MRAELFQHRLAFPADCDDHPCVRSRTVHVHYELRSPGAVTLVYATYAVLGMLGHLGVDPGAYLIHAARLLGAALMFDAVLALSGFRRWALPLGLRRVSASCSTGQGCR